MKCEMCGHEYKEEECNACGNQSCGECRCPVCGFSSPPFSKVISFIKKFRGKDDVKQ
jgi:hypothetical protein